MFTDELASYHGVPHITDRGILHRRINHSEKVYVMGDVHTNTVEGALWQYMLPDNAEQSRAFEVCRSDSFHAALAFYHANHNGLAGFAAITA